MARRSHVSHEAVLDRHLAVEYQAFPIRIGQIAGPESQRRQLACISPVEQGPRVHLVGHEGQRLEGTSQRAGFEQRRGNLEGRVQRRNADGVEPSSMLGRPVARERRPGPTRVVGPENRPREAATREDGQAKPPAATRSR